ncbi:MAG: Ig family protein [Novosphingobium sp.]|nr:Ig family protein [Novosphingobium sp.]
MIFTYFDPAEHATGTTMLSLGWTDYPGRQAGGALSPAPNWRVSAGALIATYSGAYQLPWPRTFFDTGAPITRGQVQLRDGKHCTIMGSDPFNWIQIERSSFGAGDSYTDQISFKAYCNGRQAYAAASYTGSITGDVLTVDALLTGRVEPGAVISGTGITPGTMILENGTGVGAEGTYIVSNSHGATGSIAISQPLWFDYYARYAKDLQYNQYLRLPDVANVTWVIDGDELFLFVDGVPQKLRFGNDTNWELPSIPIPPHMVGGQLAGYNIAQSSNAAMAYPLTLRDNFNYIEIRQITTERHDASTSSLRIPIFCNVGDSTQAEITILDGAGDEIISDVVDIDGENGSLLIGPIPKIYTGTALKIRAVNLDGVLTDIATVSYTMPETIYQHQPLFGNNTSGFAYYGADGPFNDLARYNPWELKKDGAPDNGYVIAYPWQDPSLYMTTVPSSWVDLQPNGSPIKFPDDPSYTILMRLGWYGELGDYIIDVTEWPHLIFHLEAAPTELSKFSLTMHGYGANRHKLTILDAPIAHFSVRLERNPDAPNNGMPTSSWLLAIPKVGSRGAWNATGLTWWRRSALASARHMSSQLANELPNYVHDLPTGLLTPENRTVRSSQTWGTTLARPAVAIEDLIEWHNLLGLDMCLNVPRIASREYNLLLAELLRDNLRPDLRIILPRANEVWNFGFVGARVAYRKYGLARGLGRQGAGFTVTANLVDDSDMITVTATAGTIEVATIVSGAGIEPGTAIAGARITYSTVLDDDIISVTAIAQGVIEPGKISGPNIAAGATLSFDGTGTGRLGTYRLSVDATGAGSNQSGVQWHGTGTGGTGTYRLSADANASGTAVSLHAGGAVYGADNGTWPATYPQWQSGIAYSRNALVEEETANIRRATMDIVPVIAEVSLVAGSNVMTVLSVASGVIEVNGRLRGAGITDTDRDHTDVFVLGTGTGGAGTYFLTRPAVATVTTTMALNKPPYQDNFHWQIVQSETIALYRGHVEDSQDMWDDFITVFGSQEAFLARCTPLVEVWATFFESDARTYLEWGDNIARGVQVATGAYFGGSALEHSGASSAVLAANATLSGEARIDVFMAAIRDEADLAIVVHEANARALRNIVTDLGYDPDTVSLGIYEGGPDVRSDLGVYAPDPVAFRTDWFTMWRYHFLDLYEYFWRQMAERVGGSMFHFDTFFDMENRWGPTPLTYYQTNFGLSQNRADMDFEPEGPSGSSRFGGLQAASITYGGEIIDEPARPRRRRSQSPR